MRSTASSYGLSAFSYRTVSRVVDLSMTCREVRDCQPWIIRVFASLHHNSIWVHSSKLKAGDTAKSLVDYCASPTDSVDG